MKQETGSALGISKSGIAAALDIKKRYQEKEPILMPGEDDRLVVPEVMLNQEIDLASFEDPLPLALISVRDPEGSMALAATARLCPLGDSTELVRGVVDIVSQSSKHELVRDCLKYVTDHAFEPSSLATVSARASQIVADTRRRFTARLRSILTSLLDGEIAPRQFVRDFFELTETGNLRHDIRKKLVLSLLLSNAVRPSIKFVMLENFERMPRSVQLGIVAAVLKAEPSRHTDFIKEELHYIVMQSKADREGWDLNGRPPADKSADDGPGLLSSTGFPMPQEAQPKEEPTPWFLI